MRTDGQTDGRTDMVKLIVAFCNFENTPKNMKKCKLKLKYNYSIIKDFFSKTPHSNPPCKVHWDRYAPHAISGRRKNRGRQQK